jgi:hypothetical protein
MRTNHKSNLPLAGAACILLTLGVSAALAANTSIGLAVANGSFQVDRAQVWGSSSLFEGSTVETTVTASQIQVNGGVDVRLAAGSRVKVYRQRMVLEQGFTQIQAAAGYAVEARSLTIATGAREAVARIKLDGARKVTVAALGGPVEVRNGGGLLVARVEAGRSLDFEPQTDGAAAPTRASGCLLEKAGKPILVDQTANVVLELNGSDLDKEVGNRVQIVGMAAGTASEGTGATQAIKVAGLTEIGKGGCTAIAKKVGASVTAGTTAAAAGATSGAGAGATAAGAGGAAGAAGGGIGLGTIAIIGGVAAAATVGGLAATGSLPGQSQSSPSASR